MTFFDDDTPIQSGPVDDSLLSPQARRYLASLAADRKRGAVLQGQFDSSRVPQQWRLLS